MHKGPSEPVILFANPPPLHDLCAVTVTLTSQVTLSQAGSATQPQILKCREIIFTESGILATPSFDQQQCFYIVLEQTLYRSGKLLNRLQTIGLEVSKPYRVTPSLYESCLRYTLIARTAPTWNKAGEWLIQGRDFLSHTGYANAIKMNLSVNSEELFVSLLATSVKFPPLQVIDLDVDDHFLRQLENSVLVENDLTLFNCWCHVLPSMKRGRICSVSSSIPQDGPFRSYRDLKRHWKNTYGYRLPESEDDILFYQISFRQNGGKLFTYPSICLRATDMQMIPRIDPKPILVSFIQDLHSKLPSVCGRPLKFLPKVRYAIPNLYESGEVLSGVVPNLTTKNPHPSNVGLRSIKDLPDLSTQRNVAASKCKSSSQHKVDQHSNPQSHNHLPLEGTSDKQLLGSMSEDMSTEIERGECVNNKSKYDSSRVGTPISTLVAQHIPSHQQLNCITDQQNAQQDRNQISRVVPSFKPKALKSASQIQQIPASKVVPSFQPKPKSSWSSQQSSSKTSQGGLKSSFMQKFSMDQQNNPSMFLNKQSARENSLGCNATLPFLSDTVPSQTLSREMFIACDISSDGYNRPFFNDSAHQLDPINNSSGQSTHKPSVFVSGTKRPKHCSSQVLNCPSFVSSNLVPFPQNFISHSNSEQGTSLFKRKVTTVESEELSSTKKPRTKPQIQDLDVPLLARTNQLNKVNTVTLQAWLKQRGVVCKAKDKKADLVAQVQHILALKTSEI